MIMSLATPLTSKVKLVQSLKLFCLFFFVGTSADPGGIQ